MPRSIATDHRYAGIAGVNNLMHDFNNQSSVILLILVVKVVHKAMVLPNIKQYLYDIPKGSKLEVLCRLIDYYNPKRSMIFCNTKKMQVPENIKLGSTLI